jgi:hypothetical protein
MTAATATLAPPTATEVKELAVNWYRKLDIHAPLFELLPMVATDAEMKFPEATLRGLADFEGWYERVIRVFFDEDHQVREVSVTPRGDEADVKVVVHWEASVWNAPAPSSNRIKLDAYQTWTVRRLPETGKLVIAKYTVDKLAYEADSAKL